MGDRVYICRLPSVANPSALLQLRCQEAIKSWSKNRFEAEALTHKDREVQKNVRRAITPAVLLEQARPTRTDCRPKTSL
jgi:hypothetical protein